MWRFAGGCLVLSVLCLIPTASEAQKKKDDGAAATPGRGTDAQYALLAKQPYISGKVVSVNPGGSSIAFTVETSHYEPNNTANKTNTPKTNTNINRNTNIRPQVNSKNPAQAAQQRLMQQYQQQARMQQQAMQQYMQQMAKQQNGKLVKDSLEFEVPVSEKVVTRKETFGTEYDDKGSVKKPSTEELAKLKGTDKSKPGY